MNIIQNNENKQKIKKVFCRYSHNTKIIPNQKIKKFFIQLGFTSELFFYDFYYYFPKVEKGADLSYEDCLTFIDYILTPKKSSKEIMDVFKSFDSNGVGNISTTEVLGLLRKQLPHWQYERYAQIISSYGSTINYIDLFKKNKLGF